MFRFFIIIAGVVLCFNFTTPTHTSSPLQDQTVVMAQDTAPVRITKALIEELTALPQAKTWRDSGYYFRFEPVNWVVNRLGLTQSGDAIMLTTFSSSDPSSLNFNGIAVFRFNPQDFPSGITPSKGMRGQAIVGFPEDVLLCPSPSQEIGLGQNDPYFPLYLSGEMTGVNLAGGDVLNFKLPMSVQLRDLEIIM